MLVIHSYYISVIEDIERLRAQLQTHPIRELHFFVKARVKIPESRRTEPVAARHVKRPWRAGLQRIKLDGKLRRQECHDMERVRRR